MPTWLWVVIVLAVVVVWELRGLRSLWPFKSPARKAQIKAEKARLKAEEARLEAGRADWAEFTQAAASGDPDAVRASLKKLQVSSNAEAVPNHERADHSRATFRAYAEKVLADGAPGNEQIVVWNELWNVLGLEWDANLVDLLRRYLIAEAARGRLIALSDHKLLARTGEQVFVEVAAGLFGEQSAQVQGQSIEQVFVAAAAGLFGEQTEEGTLSITSERVVFLGSKQSIEFDYQQLAAVDYFKDGIRFQVTNAETLIFKMADGWSDVVRAIIDATRANPPQAVH